MPHLCTKCRDEEFWEELAGNRLLELSNRPPVPFNQEVADIMAAHMVGAPILSQEEFFERVGQHIGMQSPDDLVKESNMSLWTDEDRKILREQGWTEEQIRNQEKQVNSWYKSRKAGLDTVIGTLVPLSPAWWRALYQVVVGKLKKQ